jgi:hypothetical protein
MDFGQFEPVTNEHKRKGGYTLVKEASFDDFKYRKSVKKQKGEDGKVTETIEGRFYISKKRWDSMNLDTNGLRQFTAPDGTTIIAVVSNDDATILKLSKKSKDGKKVRNFKSTNFELALEALKLLDTSKVGENQYLKLSSVGTKVNIKGISVSEAFTLSIGNKREKTTSPLAELAKSALVVESKAETVAADDWN